MRKGQRMRMRRGQRTRMRRQRPSWLRSRGCGRKNQRAPDGVPRRVFGQCPASGNLRQGAVSSAAGR